MANNNPGFLKDAMAGCKLLPVYNIGAGKITEETILMSRLIKTALLFRICSTSGRFIPANTTWLVHTVCFLNQGNLHLCALCINFFNPS